MPVCAECHTTVPDDAKFCQECGNVLAGGQARTSSPDALIGRELGAYRIVAPIGEGGMGKVYRAEQISLGRAVCVKTLLPQFATNEEVVQRFEREARAASSLRHPNIVNVIDFGRSDGLLYLVMDLVEGVDLAHLLDDLGSLPPRRATDFASQVLSALAEAHAADIVHRDLKPANVLLSELRDGSELVKVTDFGIAKVIGEPNTRITATGMLCGTPSYMAPEQIRAEPIDARADIYAMGVLLYALLTGAEPFDGDTVHQVLQAHLSTAPVAPSQRSPVPLPPELDTIVLRALEKKRERRFQTAVEFKRALDMLTPGMTPVVAGHSEHPTAASVTHDWAGGATELESLRKWVPDNLLKHVTDLQSLMAGEKRNVTVLFGDISNFTSMTELLGAEEVRSLMNRCFDGMVEAVERHGGTVDKFMGDAIMVLFGAPVAHEDDPLRAVRCALDMMRSLATLSRTLPYTVKMRVGINCGEVIAGGVGGKRRMDYTVMGDVVNVAQRLQSNAEVGTILVSEAIQRRTRHNVSYRELSAIQVKGKNEPLAAFEVVRWQQTAERLRRPLLGRREEMAKLKQVLKNAHRGRVAGALIVGEPGIGKTHLLDAVAAVAAEAGMAVARAQGGSLGLPAHLGVLRQAFLSAVGDAEPRAWLRSLDIAAAAVKRLERLYELGAGRDVAPASQTQPNLEVPLSQLSGDDALVDAAALHEPFQRLAERTGLCLIIDDAHLADEVSLRELAALLTSLPRQRLAIIATARAGQSDVLLPRLPRLELRELEAQLLRKIAQTELGQGVLPRAVADLVVERSDGNPLTAVEIIRQLVDNSQLLFQAGTWRVQANFDAKRVPVRVAQIMLGRSDSLSAPARALLRAAAVLGMRVEGALLAAVAPVGGATTRLGLTTARVSSTAALGAMRGELGVELSRAVQECIHRGFLVDDEASPGNYRFARALMRDVMLSTLMDADRRALHLTAAEALERGVGPNAISFDAIAEHFEAAGKTRKAVLYWERAADRLSDRAGHEGAILRLERALQLLLKEHAASVRPQKRLATQIYVIAAKLVRGLTLRAPSEAVQVVERLPSNLPARVANTERAILLCVTARAHVLLGQGKPALQLLEEGEPLVSAREQPGLLAAIARERSAAFESAGNLVQATQALVDGFRHIAGNPNIDAAALCEHLNQLGRIHFRAAQPERAEDFFNNALTYAQRGNDARAEARVLGNLGALRASRGDAASGLSLLRQALALAEREADRLGESRAHYNIGRVHVLAGRDEEAVQSFDAAAQLARRIGWREGLALAVAAKDQLVSQARNGAR